MTLEQLRIFVAVAERLHVTRAAEALSMTQSAVSAAVQALEARTGIDLFDRVGRRIELTQAGRTLLPEAKAVLGRLAQAEQILAELGGLERGHLTLWASQTIANYWLPQAIWRFRAQHPKLTVALHIDNSEEVARAVAASAADLGFVEGDIEDPLLARIEIGSDELVLVSAADHPAGHGPVDTALLAKLDWVMRERGSGTRQVLEEALRSFGIDCARLSVSLELPSNEAVCRAVEAGAGVTVVSRMVADRNLAAGLLRELPFAFPSRRFFALRHGDRHRSPAETAFLALLRRAPPPGLKGGSRLEQLEPLFRS